MTFHLKKRSSGFQGTGYEFGRGLTGVQLVVRYSPGNMCDPPDGSGMLKGTHLFGNFSAKPVPEGDCSTLRWRTSGHEFLHRRDGAFTQQVGQGGWMAGQAVEKCDKAHL